MTTTPLDFNASPEEVLTQLMPYVNALFLSPVLPHGCTRPSLDLINIANFVVWAHSHCDKDVE